MTIVKPGFQTTVQDLGRTGYMKYGVTRSGVLDPFAHRIANALVGNRAEAATLEMTLIGSTIIFDQPTLIAICGGDLSPAIDRAPVPMWTPLYVPAQARLTFGECKSGFRAYLAIAGGIDVPFVMGSRATYLRGKIGGFAGRMLQAHDELYAGEPSDVAHRIINVAGDKLEHMQGADIRMERSSAGDRAEEAASQGAKYLALPWAPTAWFVTPYLYRSQIRIMPHRETHLFTSEAQQHLFFQPFVVSTQSDRMGYRLEAAATLEIEYGTQQLLSEPVVQGTIQVPPSGQPIILMADHQTTGGYPRIGQVAAVDLAALSQVRPGERIRFAPITLADAEHMMKQAKVELERLTAAIRMKIEQWLDS
jgi:antagonist of KipI